MLPLEKQDGRCPGPWRLGDGSQLPSRTDPQRLRQHAESSSSWCLSWWPTQGQGSRPHLTLQEGTLPPSPSAGARAPIAWTSTKPNARVHGQARAAWVPQVQWLLTRAGMVKGACGFQPLGQRSVVGTALRPAGNRKPGGHRALCLLLHMAASPGHQRPVPYPIWGCLVSGAHWGIWPLLLAPH